MSQLLLFVTAVPTLSWSTHRVQNFERTRLPYLQPPAKSERVPPAKAPLFRACSREATVAHRLVSHAARLCLEARPVAKAATANAEKPDGTPVSVADLAVQGFIARSLRSLFPADGFLAEEDASSLPPEHAAWEDAHRLAGFDVRAWLTSPPHAENINGNLATRCWTLDPIDGTAGFVGDGAFAIGLALMSPHSHRQHPDSDEESKVGGSKDSDGTTAAIATSTIPNVAALALPTEQIVLVADHGKLRTFSLSDDDEHTGDYGNVVINHVDADGNDCGTPWTLSGVTSDSAAGVALRHRLGGQQPARLCCGSLVKYAAVARGQAHAFVQVVSSRGKGPPVWDHAAGLAVVAASGGKVTDERGVPFTLTDTVQLEGRAIVSSRLGVDHDSLCASVTSALDEACI